MKPTALEKTLLLLFRLVLGGVFIYASLDKIKDPPDFAHLIYNYKMTPGLLINPMAIYLPWVELLTGAALITGLGRRGAAALVTAMLVLFLVALSFNYLRGHAIECGCFSVQLGPPKTKEELLHEMAWRIAVDLGLLILAAAVLYGDFFGRLLPRRPPEINSRPATG